VYRGIWRAKKTQNIANSQRNSAKISSENLGFTCGLPIKATWELRKSAYS